MIAKRLLGARVVGRHDGDVRHVGGYLPHERALAAIAISSGAEDDDDPAVAEVARGSEDGRERVRRVCVVHHDRERLPFVDRLETPCDSFDARDSLHDRFLVEVQQNAGSDGTEHVLDVEEATEWRLDRQAAGAKPAAVSADLETLGANLCRLREPERDERRTVHVKQLRGELFPQRIADVDRGRRRLGAYEESALRLEVLLHRAVEIEVILAQVREDERVEAHAVEAS